jgi:hypothetical protein
MAKFNVGEYIRLKIDEVKDLKLLNIHPHLANDGEVFLVAGGEDPTVGLALTIKDSDKKDDVDRKLKDVLDHLFGVKK